MKLFHPMAKIDGADPLFDTLFVADGCESMDDAYKQFIIWGNMGYHIKEAWIDFYKDGEWKNRIDVYKE